MNMPSEQRTIEARIKALSDQLFVSQTTTFAIFDGARNPQIQPAIQSSGLEWMCLYAGKLEPVLARAAPYLVRLEKNSSFVRTFLRDGWGQSWGICLRSTADMRLLYRHFRSFLRVKDESGRVLIFRYYDPRVMRVYLPTCTEDELQTVFGPVAQYCLEDTEPSNLLTYSRVRGVLQTDTHSLLRQMLWLREYIRGESNVNVAAEETSNEPQSG